MERAPIPDERRACHHTDSRTSTDRRALVRGPVHARRPLCGDELVASDFVGYGTGGDGQIHETHGSEAFREWLRWYLGAFTDREWTVHDVISEGEKVVARYSGWATYQGGLLDIPSTTQRVLETGILIYRLESGKVKELWSDMSDLQVVMQLGVFPVPEPQEE
jgi:predicted ester cyclase